MGIHGYLKIMSWWISIALVYILPTDPNNDDDYIIECVLLLTPNSTAVYNNIVNKKTGQLRHPIYHANMLRN